MNTGVQRSGATPPGRPHRHHPGGRARAGQRRSARARTCPLIAMAHEIPYVATATVADLHDLEAKVERAMALPRRPLPPRPRALPARLGLATGDTIRIARLAEETGLFPVFEADDGEVTGVSPIRRQVPVEDYLRLQTPLRAPVRRRHGAEVIARIQALADRNISASGCCRARTEDRSHDQPRQRTSRSRSRSTSARAAPTRPAPGGPSGRSTSTGSRPAATPARPARTCSGWLYHAEAGDYEGAWRQIWPGQPAPRGDGPRLLPPVRDRLQPRPARRGGRHQLGRAVPRRRGDPRGLGAAPPAAPTGKRVLVVGAGPCWPVRGLPPGAGSATTSTIRDAAPEPGGMMRYGIPRYRLPRDVLDAEVERILALGVELRSGSTVDRPRRGRCARGVRRRRSWPSARTWPRRTEIPAGDRGAHARRGHAAARRCRGRRAAAARPPGRGLRRRQHRHRRRPHRHGAWVPTDAIVVYRRTRDRMPAHDRSSPRRREGITLPLAVDDRRGSTAGP